MQAKSEGMKKSRKSPTSRRNNTQLRVCCNADEKVLIAENATGCSMSVSSFLRELGLGNKPISDVNEILLEQNFEEVNAEAGGLTRKQSCTPIGVYVFSDEKALITANAENHGLSVSSFLRMLGKGVKPTSTLDRDVIDDLFKEGANLARLGNLLKMWLSQDDERRFNAVGENVVRSLMEQLKATQIKLMNEAERLYDLKLG